MIKNKVVRVGGKYKTEEGWLVVLDQINEGLYRCEITVIDNNGNKIVYLVDASEKEIENSILDI